MLDTSDSESSFSHWVEPVLSGTHPLLLAFHVELPRLTHSSLILPRWLSVLRSGWSLYMGPGRTSLWPEIRAGQQCRCFLVGKFSNSRKFFFFFPRQTVRGQWFPLSNFLRLPHRLEVPQSMERWRHHRLPSNSSFLFHYYKTGVQI